MNTDTKLIPTPSPTPHAPAPAPLVLPDIEHTLTAADLVPPTPTAEEQALLDEITHRDAEIARLRAALEQIANGTHPPIDGGNPFHDAQAFARTALKGDA